VLFFGKKKNAPSTIIALLITGLASSFILMVIELGVGAEAFAIESRRVLLHNAVSAAIWIPYFRVSRRVRCTFIN